MSAYQLKDITAVVVIYNTAFSEAVSLVTLNKSAAALEQTLDVIIYDNSAGPQYTDSLDSFGHLNCMYHHDPSNPGVSKAYNFAAYLAETNQKKFLLLSDQDTVFPVEALNRYIEAVNRYKDKYLFCPILKTSTGIFSPVRYFFRRGMHWNDVTPGVYSLKNKSALNSGMMVSLSAYISVKGFNEKIQLYFSDFDFINRFRILYKEMVVLDLVCNHSLSDIDTVDANSAVRRFRHYVDGSYESIISNKDYFYLFVTVLLRAGKLSLRYRRFLFLNIFFKRYLSAKAN